jgi:hypothetical protein
MSDLNIASEQVTDLLQTASGIHQFLTDSKPYYLPKAQLVLGLWDKLRRQLVEADQAYSGIKFEIESVHPTDKYGPFFAPSAHHAVIQFARKALTVLETNADMPNWSNTIWKKAPSRRNAGLVKRQFQSAAKAFRDETWPSPQEIASRMQNEFARAALANQTKKNGKSRSRRTNGPSETKIPNHFKTVLPLWRKFHSEFSSAGKRPTHDRFGQWMKSKHFTEINVHQWKKFWDIYSRQERRKSRDPYLGS